MDSLERSSPLSFESFTVECPTCTSRLRVQDPSLIGTISSCPRCGSMVQIERADEAMFQRPISVGESVDSDAITADAGSTLDSNATTQPIGPSGFSASNIPAPPVAEREPLPDSDWQSERTQRTRQIALVVAVSLCSLLAAVTLFGYFIRSWNARQTSNALETRDPLEPSEQTTNQDSEPVSDATNDGTADVRPVDGDAVEKELPQPPADPSAPNAMQEGDLAKDSEVTTNPAPEANPPSPTLPLEESSLAEMANPDPLAEPAQDMPSSASGTLPDKSPEEPTEPNADRGTMTDLGNLAEFTPLLDLAASDFELAPTLDAPPTLAEVEVKAPADEVLDPMLIANPPEPIAIDAALAVRFAIDSPGYPLSDLMMVISQVTGVPIQIDWVSFDLSGQTVTQTVVVPKGWKTASELLEEVTGAIGAEILRDEAILTLTPSDATFDAAWAKLVEFDDFGVQASSVVSLVRSFMLLNEEAQQQPIAEWVVTREEKQLAAMAIESIRRMRGIEGKLNDPSILRWTAQFDATINPTSTSVGQWQPLDGIQPVAQLDAPETISGLLRQTARLNKATCLVNWYDARRRRLNPVQMTLPHSGQSGEALLSQTLDPFRLQVRSVDESHWWVGSEATYDRLPVLVWTTPLGANRKRFLERFAQLVRAEVDSDLRLVIDDVSDRALLLVPRYVARQLGGLLIASNSPPSQ